MGLKWIVSMIAVLVATLSLVAGSSLSIPRDQQEIAAPEQETDEQAVDRRATWLPLSNRDAENEFKELVFMAMQELSAEGRIDADVLKIDPKIKRGRWQGFCFRRTRSGRILPYICWKGDQN